MASNRCEVVFVREEISLNDKDVVETKQLGTQETRLDLTAILSVSALGLLFNPSYAERRKEGSG